MNNIIVVDSDDSVQEIRQEERQANKKPVRQPKQLKTT